MAQQQPSAPARVSFVSTVVRACARPAALRGPRGAPAARRDRSQRAPRAAAAGGAAGAGASGAVELPGGALWWQHLHGGHSTTPLYGDNWVLQRPAVGGPGLVKVQRPSPLARSAPPPPAAPPAVWHAPGSATGLGLTLTGVGVGAGAVVVDTEFVVLPERRQHPAALPPPRIAPNTAVTGIVWQRTVEEGGGERQEQVSAARLRRGSSRHSRRTQMLRFTCNLCGEVNDAAINPHAWKSGSVFARCQGCTAVHKLKDNLRIFHELAGPVFPPPELRSTFLVQEILDRIAEKNRN
ncbi:Fructose-1-phosphate phosphatase [Micractinium conductrix]|uniref:Fructose-1-phosphate phosphatase n=1 Tax=Micractinium conductrix TaxID=554055 RepID=A0A2P6V649_9CHLO|nr:Fructose-1-phosphate phosphatase [Micractinium conductrix]|eukprot:PSC69566.1 Fructose-1-phosphate phosphatase [Micractinium conductrix]